MRMHQPMGAARAEKVEDWTWNTTRRRLGVLWGLTKPYRGRTFLSFFSLLAATATALAPPLLAKYALDDAINGNDGHAARRHRVPVRRSSRSRTGA